MTKPITLGERMKRYEHQTRTTLPRRTYTLMRLDGRAFHSYTRDLERPFDHGLVLAMNDTAVALCREIHGTVFAYVQSDEISLLLTDFENHGTEPWMGGVLQKMTSLSASIATAEFNARHHDRTQRLAHFDSRVWPITDPNEVMNYFIWRQRDCVKNSITMAAQAVLSHKELDGLNANQRQELLWSKAGINWNNYPDRYKRGGLVRQEEYPGPEDSVRHRWVAEPAPHLNADPAGWLVKNIPHMPALPTEN